MGNIYENDLVYIAEHITTELNMFNDTKVRDNHLVTFYGKNDFLSLKIVEDSANTTSLRFRTKDMGATYQNIPVGFSKLPQCKILFRDMKNAAKLSLKKNSLWYISHEIEDMVGPYIQMSELTVAKGKKKNKLVVKFQNQYTAYLNLVDDIDEYHKPHNLACLYKMTNKDGLELTGAMTADECLITLCTIAMQTDLRIAKLITIAKKYGGSASTPLSYRCPDDALDTVNIVFPNQYGVKVVIQNEQIIADLIGQDNSTTYIIEKREFQNIDSLFAALSEISQLEKFTYTD